MVAHQPLVHLLPGHLGPLHPAEHVLVYLLAFGPFVLLAVTIWLTRRREGSHPRPGSRPDS